MLDVGGRPLLEWIVELLARHGITEIAINLHYKPQAITGHFGLGERWGVHIRYSIEEQLLGSAGAARRLDWYLRDGSFVVFYGDLYTDMDIDSLVCAHREALYEVENPTACGIVGLDERGCVTRFVEKPRPEDVFSRLANAGVYVVEPEVLEMIPPGVPYDFGCDLFPRMLEAGLPILGHPIQEMLIDIGTPENYCRAQQAAAERARA